MGAPRLSSQLWVIAFLIFSTVVCFAGGPAFVAGSGYDPGIKGQSLIWLNGSVQYFTDQGDLSPILAGADGDALVATAFSAWTGIPGVAVTASLAGHLSEDVNGGNIVAQANGVITAPADITSSATSFPVGVIYDYDGSVTDALLGVGAGGLADCFTNAVYGGPDNFSTAGNIVHAFVVINGVCASTSEQLPDVQYRLVRVLGRVLGLGWSQANPNVLTRNPVPTSDDFEGFPVMHFEDPISCVPIAICFPDAAVPKMDDMNSLARLYPSNAIPQLSGRIYGNVYFTDGSGEAEQQMQGVNVVARLLDLSGQPSGQFVVTSVSGFAFHGNAGNIIDGYVDANGLRYDRWGSDDLSLEGFFDLGELIIPVGQTIAEYQLTVEALDTTWAIGVGPYQSAQVTPSGLFAPVVVTVTNGSNTERDILMSRSEIAQAHPGIGSTYGSPAALPQGGAWGSWISGYGSADFFEFAAQANRTASVSVIALDETGTPSENKLSPVIGMWQLKDETGNPAPASTPSAFNSETWGMTRLDAQFFTSTMYRMSVSDFRGDGRPDYFYRASLLYADTVTPARVSLAGGVATLNGTGFKPGLQASVSGVGSTTLSATASQMAVSMPSAPQDGVATIQVTDPVSGGFSQMIGALTYGALSTDLLVMLQRLEPSTPIGAQAATAMRVRAVAADGVTPVSGATIAWSANNRLQFSACGGASSCSVLSDESGESSSFVTPVVVGASTVTIALAPNSYSPPQTQLATVVGTGSTLDLVALMPTRWIAQGATLTLPLTVEALDLGGPLANVLVNFTITQGTASLSAPNATTNGAGFAGVSAQIVNQNTEVHVSACVAPNNVPCQKFILFVTPSTFWTLETVSGSLQIVPIGQSFQPLVMRVTDGSVAANPVVGLNVVFETTLSRGGVGVNGVPVILGTSQAQVMSDEFGLASLVPIVGSVGPCDVFVGVNAAGNSAQFQMESVAAIMSFLPPRNGGPRPRGPTAPGGRHFVLPSAELPVNSRVPALLVAVPQGGSPTDLVPFAPSCSASSEADSNVDVASIPSCILPTGAGKVEIQADPILYEPVTELPANDPKTEPKVEAPATGTPIAEGNLQDRRNCRFTSDADSFLFF
jgi:hypothetical protein